MTQQTKAIEKKRPAGGALKSNIGAFDFFKGIAMLFIVCGHSFSQDSLAAYYSPDANPILMLLLFLFLLTFKVFQFGLMPAFLMLSGMGFRPRPFGKCLKQQMEMILKPYLYVAGATVSLHLVVHYLCFRYFHDSVVESLKVAAGFLLALPQSVTIGGIQIFWCGAVWYLIALMVGWLFLDLVLQYVPERWCPWTVAGVVLLGWGIGLIGTIPFCLSQGMIASGGLYLGYLMKKKKLTFLDSRFFWLAAAASYAISLTADFTTGRVESMAEGVWLLGPASIVLDFTVGLALVVLFQRFNAFRDQKNLKQFGLYRWFVSIGRNSMQIFCVHTVEMIALPWYLFTEWWTGSQLIGGLILSAVRFSLILLICRILKKYQKQKPGRKKNSQLQTEG